MSRWSDGQKIKVEVKGENKWADSIFFDRCPFFIKDDMGESFCIDESGGQPCSKNHCRLRMMADKYQKSGKKK